MALAALAFFNHEPVSGTAHAVEAAVILAPAAARLIRRIWSRRKEASPD